MARRRDLERRLSGLAGFTHARIDLEQYPTPPAIAAHLIHFAALQGDIERQVIFDLGSGPGILAIGAALRDAETAIGIEIDQEAITIARQNARSVGVEAFVSWIIGDVLHPPVCRVPNSTVLMNPPFGAQHDQTHADRQFLEVARRLGRVSYSIHNAGSQEFIEAYAADNAGMVTAGFALEFDLTRQFSFHEAERTSIPAECYRIEWDSA